MEVPIELPLDAGGFLRRECPNCEQEFKWHEGKTDQAPESFVYPPVYWCPRCGKSARHDSWWTPVQLDYAHEAIAGPALEQVADALVTEFKNSKFMKFERKSHSRPPMPDPLVEPDDMVVIAPPCHPWEPVKVPEDAVAPFYCLICGEAYAV